MVIPGAPLLSQSRVLAVLEIVFPLFLLVAWTKHKLTIPRMWNKNSKETAHEK